MALIELDPPADLSFPLQRRAFPKLCAYLRLLDLGMPFGEADLQAAMDEFTTKAVGNVVLTQSDRVEFMVRSTQNLSDFLNGTKNKHEPFVEQRVPALLIKWRAEVRDLESAVCVISGPLADNAAVGEQRLGCHSG